MRTVEIRLQPVTATLFKRKAAALDELFGADNWQADATGTWVADDLDTIFLGSVQYRVIKVGHVYFYIDLESEGVTKCKPTANSRIYFRATVRM